MTPEERFAKIEENLLVTAEMSRTADRRWEERFARHDEQIAALIRVAESHQAAIQRLAESHQAAIQQLAENHQPRIQQVEYSRLALEASMLSLEAVMRALFERMDRFIRGLESSGKK
jgi:hypothetical protein